MNARDEWYDQGAAYRQALTVAFGTPQRHAEPAPRAGLRRRLAAGLDGLSAALTLTRKILVDFAAVAAAAVLGILFVGIMLEDTVVLEAPTVPEALQERGLTPGLLTQLVQARMNRVNEIAASSKQADMASPAEEPLVIEAAGFNLSLTSLAHKAAGLLGLEGRRSLSVSVLCAQADCADGDLTLRVVALGTRVEAGDTVRFGIGDLEPAVDAAVRHLLLAFDPHLLGTYHYRQGELDAAEAVALHVIRQHGTEAIWARNLLGILAMARGKLAEAEFHLERALAEHPDFAPALVNRGNLYARQGRYEAAKASYRLALSVEPDDARAHNNLGNAFLRNCEWEEAALSYERARKADPKFASPLRGLAAVMEGGRREEAAARRLRQLARELDPGHTLVDGRAVSLEAAINCAQAPVKP